MEFLSTIALNNYATAKKAWIQKQSKTSDHKLAITLYIIICGMSQIIPSFTIWGPIVFFVITALTKMGDLLSYMIFSVVVTTIASLISPILGFIMSAIFFIMKISNFIKNWKAIFSGVFVYIFPYLLVYGNIGYYIYYAISPLNKMLYYSDLDYRFILYFNVAFIGAISGIMLHFILRWLYKSEYSAKSALSTMGSAPLIILLIVLPFIINAVGDIIDDIMSAGGSMADDFGHTIDLNGDGINDNIHDVKGHFRNTPSGGVTYVDPHIRTNPNSIITDNISYHK